VIFHSYVSLPEGRFEKKLWCLGQAIWVNFVRKRKTHEAQTMTAMVRGRKNDQQKTGSVKRRMYSNNAINLPFGDDGSHPFIVGMTGLSIICRHRITTWLSPNIEIIQ